MYRWNVTLPQAALALIAGLVAAPDAAGQLADPDTVGIVTTAAGERYRAGPFHRWILGRHYRDLWTMPVRVPVLDLEETAGGLTPTRTGGGMQTRSLRFMGEDGREYAFRSVDKDPSPVLDTLLRETVVADLVQDGISAAHPYGALVAAPLLDAVGILHVDPQLRVMPDDPALGEFREEFAGMLGLIEERPDENEGDRTSFRDTERVISSEGLTDRLDEGPDDRVDAREYLKARIMDVYLGDWDRHRGQWRWAIYDDDEPRRWLPVPRDRDQAFSKFDGVATRIVSLYMPQFVRFEDDYPPITSLHWNARAIDRWFLAGLDRQAWDSVGAAVQDALTDDVIEQAVFQLPVEIYELDGEDLASTLRSRREKLPEAWDDFYRLLADKVDVRATDADEHVVVSRDDSGSVLVTMSVPGEVEQPYFQRRFVVGETSEIRLHLRDGDDEVVFQGPGTPGITVRVVGGDGDDRFTFEGGSQRTRLYDDAGANQRTGDDAPSIDTRPYDAWEWSEEDRDQPRDWGRRTLPIFWSSYATDLGLFIGGGARFESYGFRKQPYATAFDVRAGYAPLLSKGRVEVDGQINTENSPLFWRVGGRLSRLDVLHFYGLGNDTPEGSERYHRVDMTLTSARAGLGISPEPWFELFGGVTLERTSTKENEGRFFETLGPVYGDGEFISVGIGGGLTFDPLVGNERTGNRFKLSLRATAYPGALDVEEAFGRVGGDLSVLLASSPWPAFSVHLRGGAEQVLGRFPWHKAAFVGGNATVRGFDEQRFSGDAAVYGSGEARLRLLKPRVVVPLAVGAFGFVDGGRVFLDGESPEGWHTSAGAGLYLQPAQQAQLVRIGIGQSDEATKFFILFGLPY